MQIFRQKVPFFFFILILYLILVRPNIVFSQGKKEPEGKSRIRLAHLSFDPLDETPPIPQELTAPSFDEKGQGYFFVQIKGPVTDKRKEALLESGAEIHDYIPEFTFLCLIPQSTIKTIESLDFVRWVGPFHPAYRMEKGVYQRYRHAIFAGTPQTGSGSEESEKSIQNLTTPANDMDVVIILFNGTDISRIAVKITALGGKINDTVDGKYKEKIVAGVPVKNLDKIAGISGVKWIEPVPKWSLFNNKTATLAGARPVWDTHGLRGNGEAVAVADTGLDAGSVDPGSLLDDFEDGSGNARVISLEDWAGDSPSDPDGHGTHVAGSVLGNGANSGSTPSTHTYPDTCFAGMAPEASLVFQATMDNSSGYLTGIPSDLNLLFSDARERGARIHTNSWGSTALSAAYSSYSEGVDEYTWNNKDFTILFSAGNEGMDSDANGVIDKYSVTAPATAKNCITVGASENNRSGQQYEYPQGTCNTATWGWFDEQSFSASPIYGDGMSNAPGGIVAFSSRGPCLDDRIKPEVVAPGSFVLSTLSSLVPWTQWGQCGLSSPITDYYVFMGGTSMSTPLVAGMCALIREYFSKGNFPAITNPSSALIKAVMLNGAQELHPGQYGTGSTQEIPSTRPNNVEGWGLPDIENSLFPTAPRRHILRDSSSSLSTSGEHSLSFYVNNSSEPLNVSLVWTDYFGSAVSCGGLVNDLDLELVTPTSSTLHPANARKRSNSTLLYYDDWYWDRAGSNPSGIGWAVKFTPPAYPKILRTVRFYLINTTSAAVNGTCNIWDDDGSEGMPGTLLYTQTINAKLMRLGSSYEQWITIELPEATPITISSGSFYVEYRWGNTAYLGYDTKNVDRGNDYYYNGASWSLPNSDRTQDNYIEAVVSDSDASDADHVNNVEGIDLDSPPAGFWQAKIKGYNIPQGPQPYALVISGDVKGVATIDAHSSPQPNRDLPEWNDTEPEKMSVLKFKITDRGEDNLPTLIDQLAVQISGTGGNAGSDIAWAELYDDTGAARVATAASISNAQIIFGSAPNSDDAAQLDSLSDNNSAEYAIYIYFNSTLTAGVGDTYIFDIDETDIGVDGGDSSKMSPDSGSVTPVTGTITGEFISVTVNPASWNIGSIWLGYTGESGTFTIQNTGNVSEDFAIKGTDGVGGWTLSGAAGQDAFKAEADKDDNGSYELILTTSDQGLFTNITSGGSKLLGLRYSAPTGDTKGNGVPQDFSIIITATKYTP
ncbi:S8 family serine peptidase [Candidatus Sumerlaeota bacterium]|nr:S8 family serine peptidase [Candidatus Sumerlaeota bacterium]